MKKKLNINLNPDLKKIPRRIVMLREASGLNQGATAGKMGLSRSNLKKIEEGKGLPSIPTIIQICRHYKVSSDAIIFGEKKYSEKIQEDNEVYSHENKLVVTVPSEELIEPIKSIGEAWERGDENKKGWIVVQLKMLARQAQIV